MTNKTCAIYVRVSTDKQDALNQLVDLKKYADKEDWAIFNEYVDIISGARDIRPGFDLMFLHAHQHKFDIVLFWALDRFSRAGALYTLQKLNELENCGVNWVSYTEQYFNSAGQFKDVVISIMGTLAKIERQKISERTKAGLRLAQNVGKRGKDIKPRKRRNDAGKPKIKRGVAKAPEMIYQNRIDNLT